MARLRTSGRASPFGDAQFEEAGRAELAQRARGIRVEIGARSAAQIGGAPLLQVLSQFAVARFEEGPGEEAATYPLSQPPPWKRPASLLVRSERLVGAAEIVGLHAPGLRPRLHLDRVFDADVPLGVELALGHRVGDVGPRASSSASAYASAITSSTTRL